MYITLSKQTQFLLLFFTQKQTAQDVLKTEQARIHLRQIELELMREQSRIATPPLQQGYYSLAPVQQQVLARITGSTDNQYHPPASPVAAYPHSAHPLCPPENRLNPPRQYHLHPTTPISPHDENRKRKQQHSQPEEDKLSHNKVMEALKAKIQRGSSSPLATTAPNSAFLRDNHNKKQRTLPKPIIEPTQLQQQPSTPSPRSAKPILPPIDTTIGRIPTTHLPSHPLISPTATTTVRDTTTNES